MPSKASKTATVVHMATALFLATAPAVLADGHSERDPEEVEIRMPGPWGDDYTEIMSDPGAVDADAAYAGHRRHRMQLLSGYYRSLEMALRYNAPLDPEIVADLAEGLERHGQQIPRLFERETSTPSGESGALQRIWEEPEHFQRHADNFAKRAGELREAIPSSSSKAPDDWEPQATEVLNGVRHQCLACHDTFRRR